MGFLSGIADYVVTWPPSRPVPGVSPMTSIGRPEAPTAMEKVNQVAGVEDVHTHMDNNHIRLVARSVEDPSKMGDIMPLGFGDDRMLDDELAEEGDGRRWNDHGPEWVNKEGKKDGFVFTRMVSILQRESRYGGAHARE